MSEQPSSAGEPLGSHFVLHGATVSSSPAPQAPATPIAQAVRIPFWGSTEHRLPQDLALLRAPRVVTKKD